MNDKMKREIVTALLGGEQGEWSSAGGRAEKKDNLSGTFAATKQQGSWCFPEEGTRNC